MGSKLNEVLLREIARLGRGEAHLEVQAEGTTYDIGQSIAENCEGVTAVLEDLAPETRAPLQNALNDAVRGHVIAAKAFQRLRAIGEAYAAEPATESGKLGQAIGSIAESLEGAALIYKTMLASFKDVNDMVPLSNRPGL